MVSLKKEPKEPPIREVTPVHLMDENEAVRIYCPPRENAENGIKISVKQADKNLLPAIKDNAKPKEHTLGGMNKWKWAEIVIAVFVSGAVAFIEFLFSALILTW